MNAPLRMNAEARKRHREAARFLLHVLDSGDLGLWSDAPAVLDRKLTEEECAFAALSFLKALPVDVALPVVEAWAGGTEFESALPDVVTGKISAAEWARRANANELKAYTWAAVTRMSTRDRESLKRKLNGDRG